MNEAAALVQARRQLLDTLDALAGGVVDQVAIRCPYRAREDRCTFPSGCRNQRATPRGGARLCSGAPLNNSPAQPHQP